MRYTKSIIAAALAVAGMATSCSDEWNDHYEVRTQGEGTLWQTISQNPELSNFAAVVEATGYKTALDGSQVFTVFAPTNASLTDSQRDQLIAQYNKEKDANVKDERNTVVKEFIQNHIALYNYSLAKNAEATSLAMMNKKVLSFGSSDFDGVAYNQTNVATGNGVLFTLNGQATYKPNIREQIDRDPDLDSVSTFLQKYDVEYFYADESVPGEIIDGKIHYLDSVTTTYNTVTDMSQTTDRKYFLNAYITDEDSSYVMLAPTNEEWARLLERNKKYFVYDDKVAERDSFEYILPRYLILRGGAFSTNINTGLLNQTSDSIFSTNSYQSYLMRTLTTEHSDYNSDVYYYPFAEGGVMTGVTTDFTCSNGVLKKSAAWPIHSSQTFLQTKVYEAESRDVLDSLNTGKTGDTQTGVRVNVATTNPYRGLISDNAYLSIKRSGSAAISNASFTFKDLMSNVPYNVYIVLAPEYANDTLAYGNTVEPVEFQVMMQCHDTDGNAQYIGAYRTAVDNNTLSDPRTVSYVAVTENENVSMSLRKYRNVRINNMDFGDGKNVQKVLVGQYIFPTSSVWTSQPQVKMLLSGSILSDNPNINIDCFIFEPVLDDLDD